MTQANSGSNLSRKGSKNSPSSSPKRSPNPRRGYNSPKRGQIEPSKLLYAPKPFIRQDSSSSKSVQKPEFNAAVNKIQSLASKKAGYQRKPAVPPKPRNVVVKQRSHSSTKSKKSESLSSFHSKSFEDKNDQNDSGLSGKLKISETIEFFLPLFIVLEEADDVFNDMSPIRNCSFASLSQKIDDQRWNSCQFFQLNEKSKEFSLLCLVSFQIWSFEATPILLWIWRSHWKEGRKGF